MKRFNGLVTILFILGLADFLTAGNSSSHTIAIQVQRPNALTVLNGSDLKWTSDQSGKKITASADLATAESKIQVQAVNCIGGLPAGAVPLSTSDQEIVKTTASATGGCSLDFAAGIFPDLTRSNDKSQVVYTITDAF